MAEKMAIAIGYYTNELGERKFHTLTKDESWFWRGMRKRLSAGTLESLKTCAIAYLEEPVPVKTVRGWTATEREERAPDVGFGSPPETQMRIKKQKPMNTLLDEIRERKLINALANLAKEPINA